MAMGPGAPIRLSEYAEKSTSPEMPVERATVLPAWRRQLYRRRRRRTTTIFFLALQISLVRCVFLRFFFYCAGALTPNEWT
jgi:hypothetical protein